MFGRSASGTKFPPSELNIFIPSNIDKAFFKTKSCPILGCPTKIKDPFFLTEENPLEITSTCPVVSTT